MAYKNVPKKYMMVFQKMYGGQDAVEFSPDAAITMIPIIPFTDKKINGLNKKESIIKKNTLAFYDAITNKFSSFQEFVITLGDNLYPFDYKNTTSYIGYIDDGYMRRLSISFNDPILASIALNADGNNINKNNKETIEIVTDIIDMIEDPNCDFVSCLQTIYTDKQDKRFSFSKSLIDNIVTYRATKRIFDNSCKQSGRMDQELLEDLNVFKRNFLSKIQSYKNFRELYRFRKQYLFDKEARQAMNVIASENKTKQKEETIEERYEEVRQKNYPRQKIKEVEIPGQLSLFE